MTYRSYLLSRLVVCATFVGAVVLVAEMNRVPAQQAGKGQERLNYEEKAYKEKAREIKPMLQGEIPADKKTLDLAAQHYAYRLTMTELQTKQGKMPQLVKEAMDEVDGIRRADPKINEAGQIFNTALIARLKEVLPNPRPIASMNAARILAHMAGQGQEEVADVLSEVLSDKDMNGGTKLFAARGLHDLYMLALAPEVEQRVYFKNKEREARSIKALLAALDIKPLENPPPSAEEIEGIRYLRRELIRALGASRYPAATDASGASQGKTALALARVLRNDGFKPTPSASIPFPRMDEQVEAAIGLAMLKVSPDPGYKAANEYQLDVAAHHLGRFLVDLARRHQTRKADEPAPKKQAWKTSGARLGVALASLSAESNLLRRNDPNKYRTAYEFVNEMVKLSLPILKGIEADGTAAADQLDKLLQTSTRENEPIYKGDPTSIVKAAATELTTDSPKEKAPDEDKK